MSNHSEDPGLNAFGDDEETLVPTPIINMKVFTARMDLDTALENERKANGNFMLSLQGRTPTDVTPGANLGLVALEARNATDKARQHLDGLLREALPLGEDFQRQCREKAKREATSLLTGLGDRGAGR